MMEQVNDIAKDTSARHWARLMGRRGYICGFTLVSVTRSGKDQVTRNRLTIIDQSTGLQVYQQTQITFGLFHNLPANTLVNVSYYSAYINTFNATGSMSVNSNTIQFYCFTTHHLLY